MGCELSESFERLAAQYVAQGGVTQVFSAKVADYVASRPDYAGELFDELDRLLAGCTKPARIADVGAGTGLLTRDLLARGHDVLAVEPNDAMRAAADHFLGAHPRYRSVNAKAEAIPVADHSLDLVTAGTAFHWFDVPKARAECLRVLKPGGVVALTWNDRVLSDPFHQAFDEIAGEFGGDKRNALLAHESRDDVPALFGGSIVNKHAWPHAHVLDMLGVASLLFSRSYMPPRDSADGQRVVAAVRAVFERMASNGKLIVRYNTVAHIGRPL